MKACLSPTNKNKMVKLGMRYLCGRLELMLGFDLK